MALVGSVALLLVLLRYISINLISSDQDNIKEVSMAKKLTARTRVFFSSFFEQHGLLESAALLHTYRLKYIQ